MRGIDESDSEKPFIGEAWMTSAAQPTCCRLDTSTSGEQADGTTLGIIFIVGAVEYQHRQVGVESVSLSNHIDGKRGRSQSTVIGVQGC